jgi:hypothetical protein
LSDSITTYYYKICFSKIAPVITKHELAYYGAWLYHGKSELGTGRHRKTAAFGEEIKRTDGASVTKQFLEPHLNH